MLYLALRNSAKKRTMPIPHWSQGDQAFSIIFEGRVPTPDENSFTQFIRYTLYITRTAAAFVDRVLLRSH